METQISPTWVTYEEAQRLTSLGRTTLWRLASTREIKTARVGRAVRINVASLEAYMESVAEEVIAS
jgi:excisionase family DNA binding protein